MAFTYSIKESSLDSNQMTPFWIVAFDRFKFRDTYNHDPSNPGSIALLNTNATVCVQEQSLLIVENDCVTWQTTSSKESHLSNIALKLLFTDTDYTAELAPNDWVLFWAFNNYDDYFTVLNKIKKGQRANSFFDGLKFVGRIQSILRNEERNPLDGRFAVSFQVSGIGYSELDATIYYNEYVRRQFPNTLLFLENLSVAITDLISNGLIPSSRLIPKLLDILLGIGTSTITTSPSPEVSQTYMIPPTVAKLLLDPKIINTKLAKKVGFTYVDILKHWIGIQTYSKNINNTIDSDQLKSSKSFDGFVPDINSTPPFPTFNTNFGIKDLPGQQIVTDIHWNNPLWNILQAYVNAPMNEMYTCLRVDEFGFVLPTLITRQIPFSSKKFTQGQDATAFIDIPRWSIDSSMLQKISVGRSDAVRHNYVHIIAVNPRGAPTSVQMANNYVIQPPIFDIADIRRSGLRKYEGQISSALVLEATLPGPNNPAGVWTRLMADYLFGLQLKYTGMVVCKGIQEPIAEGDNCVINNVIYHIERVIHSGNRNEASGIKEFMTMLHLSNGISILSDKNQDITIYPGFELSGDVADRGGIDISSDEPTIPNDFLKLQNPSNDNLLYGNNKGGI